MSLSMQVGTWNRRQDRPFSLTGIGGYTLDETDFTLKSVYQRTKYILTSARNLPLNVFRLGQQNSPQRL